jgi:HEAT repeat protein
MKRILILLFLCLSSTVFAATPGEITAVTQTLSRIDQAPSKAALLKASPDAASILLTLSADTRALPWHRHRALAAVAHFPSPEARSTLRRLVRDETQGELLRGRALLALGRAFKDDSIGEVSAYLTDRSTVLQGSAVQALGHLGTPAALQQLKTTLRKTRDRDLRQSIRTTLRDRSR